MNVMILVSNLSEAYSHEDDLNRNLDIGAHGQQVQDWYKEVKDSYSSRNSSTLELVQWDFEYVIEKMSFLHAH